MRWPGMASPITNPHSPSVGARCWASGGTVSAHLELLFPSCGLRHLHILHAEPWRRWQRGLMSPSGCGGPPNPLSPLRQAYTQEAHGLAAGGIGAAK